MDKFIKTRHVLGSGTYGEVIKGYEKNEDGTPGRSVAIKRLFLKNQLQNGLDIAAIRDIKFLKELSHPNVIELVDVCIDNGKIKMVMECCKTDLAKIINTKSIALSPADIKCYLKQLLEGLDFCHSQFLLHRDLKPGNLLISEDGIVKLTDFGLARLFGLESERLSPEAVTIWYRAPELLYGSTKYTTGVDMWSVGCIFAEMWLARPLFATEPPHSELSQLKRIYSFLGTPTEKDWQGIKSLPLYFEPLPIIATPFETVFAGVPDDAIDLLKQFLSLSPHKRISCKDALNHPYFSNDPEPTQPNQLILEAPQTPEAIAAAAAKASGQVVRKLTWD